MTLKELKEIFTVINHNNKYILYKNCEYNGYLIKENTKWFYVGYPEDKPIRIKTIDDINKCNFEFLIKCQKDWIDFRSFDPMIAKCYSALYALDYLAKKFNLTTKERFSDYYSVKSAFGATIFDIKAKLNINKDICIFEIIYSNGMFTESPEFTNYQEAMNWLKGLFSSMLITTGIEFIGMAINNNLMNSKMEEVIAKYIDYSDLSTKEFNVTNYMINILEKQLEILKNSKNK